MSTWGAVAFVFALVATVGFLDWMAVLFVRAEERWKQAEEAERRAARRAGDRAAGEG